MSDYYADQKRLKEIEIIFGRAARQIVVDVARRRRMTIREVQAELDKIAYRQHPERRRR